jgi:hypothetical protein
MAHFNIVHVINDSILGVRAYQEVIDSVRWGLEQLGHDIACSVNRCDATATNIVFGGHLLPELLVASPKDTIYYNLEQISHSPQYVPSDSLDTTRFVASNLQIWDYSCINIETWNKFNPKFGVKFVPIGYAPVLSRVTNAPAQDIDILIYGSVGERRLAVFSELGRLVNIGISAVFATGLYGATRDSLIARSKLVLNINNITHSRIFEIVRVSYLLANSKAVVADVSPDSYIESDIVSGVKFVPVEEIPRACRQLLQDEALRSRLERQGFECITRRDIRVFLAAALA